jgi:L,D-peptidoglycan transpeptidase YkuD (ErfK/YbiS/YcfS/YnhG family)
MGRRIFFCAVGKRGFVTENHKQEGDCKTPCGQYQFLAVYYRPDRVDVPKTSLPTFVIKKESAWCDDTTHPFYNRYFDLNTSAAQHIKSFENLWRDDHLYDIFIVVNHNCHPVVPGKGSAIFIHSNNGERPPYKPSLGCLKLNIDDLQAVLSQANKDSTWDVPKILSRV